MEFMSIFIIISHLDCYTSKINIKSSDWQSFNLNPALHKTLTTHSLCSHFCVDHGLLRIHVHFNRILCYVLNFRHDIYKWRSVKAKWTVCLQENDRILSPMCKAVLDITNIRKLGTITIHSSWATERDRCS